MIRENAIDRLTMALVLSSELKTIFIDCPEKRVDAIVEYNEKCREQHGGKKVELNEEEYQLVASLQATDIQQYIGKLAEILEKQKSSGALKAANNLLSNIRNSTIIAA